MRKQFLTLFLSLALVSFGNPYVMGELMGQLGNQYFQIAATVSLALDHGATPIFPCLTYETEWNVPINYEQLFSHLDVSMPEDGAGYQYLEPTYTYQPIPYEPNMSIRGWFQSEKYFVYHKAEVLQLFATPPPIIEYLTLKYKDLIKHPLTVAIHYRSYEKEDPNHKVYANITLDYYKQAIARFPKGALFVVFSNDIEWCKKTFASIPCTFRFIEGETHYCDLHLMSMCRHQIICNSSFSWWGAYLNANPMKQVIAPKVWFSPSYHTDDRDLIPDTWLRL